LKNATRRHLHTDLHLAPGDYIADFESLLAQETEADFDSLWEELKKEGEHWRMSTALQYFEDSVIPIIKQKCAIWVLQKAGMEIPTAGATTNPAESYNAVLHRLIARSKPAPVDICVLSLYHLSVYYWREFTRGYHQLGNLRVKQSHFSTLSNDPSDLPTIQPCPPVESIVAACYKEVEDKKWGDWALDSELAEYQNVSLEVTDGNQSAHLRRKKRMPLDSVAIQLFQLGHLTANTDKTFTVKDFNDKAHAVQIFFKKNIPRFHCSCNPTKECVHIKVVKIQLNMDFDDDVGNIAEQRRRHKPVAQRKTGHKAPRLGDDQNDTRKVVNAKATEVSDVDDDQPIDSITASFNVARKNRKRPASSIAADSAETALPSSPTALPSSAPTVSPQPFHSSTPAPPPSSPAAESAVPPAVSPIVHCRVNLLNYSWFQTALETLDEKFPHHLLSNVPLKPTRSNPLSTEQDVFQIVQNVEGEIACIYNVSNDDVYYATAFKNCELEEFKYHAACTARRTKSAVVHVHKQACQTDDNVVNALALCILQVHALLQKKNIKNLHFSNDSMQHVINNPKTFLDKSEIFGIHGKMWTGQHKDNIPLYCCCKMPHLSFKDRRDSILELDDMCKCVQCKTWYFRTCMNIPKKYFRKYDTEGKPKTRNMEWRCKECRVFALPKVPSWSTEIAINTCTVDNILTIIFMYAFRHNPAFIQ
jgi:hypothetical protein